MWKNVRKDTAPGENFDDITIDRFSYSAARGKELSKDPSSIRISRGKRYGLVGPNGMSKYILLNLLAWRKIKAPKNMNVVAVGQELVEGDDKSALEAVVSANEELVNLREEAASLKLRILGSDAAEAQASRILAGLGFTKDMQARSTKSFSGGWRMRISLARALFMQQPTLLLLYEPTNHLDLRAVLWLGEYLCRRKKTLIVVSRDRDFLNTVCTEIIHLHYMRLHMYHGNLDDFESGIEQRCIHGNLDDFESGLELRCKVNKKTYEILKALMFDDLVNKKRFEIFEAPMAITASKAKGKVDEEESVVEAPREWSKATGKVHEEESVAEAPRKRKDYAVEFHFPEPTELTPPLLQLIDVSFSYPSRPDFKLSDVDVGIDMGTRVAIVGPNGAGKSTLLNLLAGDLVPCEGEVRRSQELRIGRYSQHFSDLLTTEENPVRYLLRLHPDQDQEEGLSKFEAVQAKLENFGLPGDNHLKSITKLSGGQKARVVFTSISMSKPHMLLLDEPTDDLDMQSIDALASALDEFTGGVVLVSHDSRLISRVCGDEAKSEIWIVEGGTVRVRPGAFDEYKEALQKEIREEVDDQSFFGVLQNRL